VEALAGTPGLVRKIYPSLKATNIRGSIILFVTFSDGLSVSAFPGVPAKNASTPGFNVYRLQRRGLDFNRTGDIR
jgi:hypothetical protein